VAGTTEENAAGSAAEDQSKAEENALSDATAEQEVPEGDGNTSAAAEDTSSDDVAADSPDMTEDGSEPTSSDDAPAEDAGDGDDATDAVSASGDDAPEPEAEPEASTEDAVSEADSTSPADAPSGTKTDEAASAAEAEPQSEPAQSAPAPEAAAPAPQVIKETTVERKGGFFPMLLGGAVAAGLGFGASEFLEFGPPPEEDPFRTETRDTLTSQMEQIQAISAGLNGTQDALADVSAQVGGIDVAPLSQGLSDVEQSLAALRADLAGVESRSTEVANEFTDMGAAMAALDARLDGAETRVAALDARLTELGDRLGEVDARLLVIEKRPVEEAVSPDVIAVYERELNTLREEIIAQRTTINEERTALRDEIGAQRDALSAEISAQQEALSAEISEQQVTLESEKAAMLDDFAAQRAEVEEIISAARAAEVSAEEQAALAASRAALADLTTRAQTGTGFAEPLAVLMDNGVFVPDALKATAESGLPTLAALATDFPEAARAALRSARRAAPAEERSQGGGLAGFLQNQMGARSVVPREGDDPDAVLSRAEAAVQKGDLDTALTEIAALPEAAQADLADWVAAANLRRDALAGASALAQQLNQQ